MLVGAIVVAGDRPGADIRALADAGVADIRQVIDLGASFKRRRLHLDEIADLGLRAELRARPQARERADRGSLADVGTFEVRERTNGRALLHHDTRPEHDVGLDDDVRSKLGIGREEYGCGRHQGDAGFERRCAQLALQHLFRLRELRPRVDAPHFVLRGFEGDRRKPQAPRDLHCVG